MFDERWDSVSEMDGPVGGAYPWAMGSLLNTLNWDRLRDEVAAEARGRVAIVGLRGAGKSTLVNSMRGWTVSLARPPEAAMGVDREDLGLFYLVDLPYCAPCQAAGPDTWPDGLTDLGASLEWEGLAGADLIVFLFDGALFRPEGVDSVPELGNASLQALEYQWYCRVRALGRPMLPVLNKCDLLANDAGAAQQELQRRLGSLVRPLCARDETAVTTTFLTALLDHSPRLSVAVGRELPAVRHSAALRLIRQATVLTTLSGMQPLPLLDIPLQLTTQVRLLQRLNALHGRPDRGDGSRQLLAAVAGGMGLRMAIQQLAKLVPVLGWLVSGLLSGVSTWLIGQGALAHIEGHWRGRVKEGTQLPAIGRLKNALRARKHLRIRESVRRRQRSPLVMRAPNLISRLRSPEPRHKAFTRLHPFRTGNGRRDEQLPTSKEDPK